MDEGGNILGGGDKVPANVASQMASDAKRLGLNMFASKNKDGSYKVSGLAVDGGYGLMDGGSQGGSEQPQPQQPEQSQKSSLASELDAMLKRGGGMQGDQPVQEAPQEKPKRRWVPGVGFVDGERTGSVISEDGLNLLRGAGRGAKAAFNYKGYAGR